MKAPRTTALCSLVMFLAGWTSASYAQSFPPAPAPGAPGDATLGFVDPGNVGIGYAVSPPFGPWVGFDGRVGDGIGWKDGYYGGNVFIPRHIDPGVSLMFTQVNISATSGGQGVVNAGAGYRYRNPSLNRIFGLSGWFDYDDGNDEEYTRVGLSLETLGKWMDARLNTYFVLGNDQNKVAEYVTGGPYFQTNYLWLTRQTVWENAYSGADLEVGGPIPFIGRYGLSGYIGPYWLHHEEDEDVVGVKVRLMAQINEDLAIGAQFSNDDVFSNNAFLNVQLTIPDGRPSRWFRPTPMRERMGQQVVRENRVAVNKKVEATADPLINPADGLPITFGFISALGTGTGIGTFENPVTFNNFVNSPGVDVILVSDGVTQQRAGTLALFNGQRFLGTGIQSTVTSTRGTFVIPGTGNGNTPILQTSNGTDILQLANNNEVAGLRFDGSNGANPPVRGIISQPGGITGFNIHDNVFTNNRDGAALYVTGSGYGVFQNNTLTGAGATSNRGFSVMTAGGGTNLALLVANNTATNYQGRYEDLNNNNVLDPGEDLISGVNPNILGGNGNSQLDRGTAFEITATTGSTINANAPGAVQPTGIFGNVETASGTGLLINGVTGGTVNASITGNSFQNNVDINTGMRAVANGGTINLTNVSNNVIQDNAGNNVALIARNGGLITGSFTTNLMSFTVANVNSRNAMLIDADNSVVRIDALTDNFFNRVSAGTAGIFVNAANNSVVTLGGGAGTANLLGAPIVRNQFIGGNANTTFGIGGTITDSALNLYLGDGTLANQNTLQNNRGASIGFNLAGASAADLRVRTNAITGTTAPAVAIPGFTGQAIRVNMSGTSTLAATSIIDSNTITTHVGGVFLQALGNAEINGLAVSRNSITGGTGDGMNFNRQQAGRIQNVLITDNIVTGNTGAASDGIDITAAERDVQDTYTLLRNFFNGNGGRGLLAQVVTNADLRIDMHDVANNIAGGNTFTGNGASGIQQTLTTVNPAIETPSFTGIWTGNTISNNTAAGSFGIVLAGNYRNLEIGRNGVDTTGFTLGNTISGNNQAGIQTNGFGDFVAGDVSSIVNNTISGNGTGLAAGNGAGIDINMDAGVATVTASTAVNRGQNFNILNNRITGNNGDGLEILASSPVNAAPAVDGTLRVNALGNTITGNVGRGVDILNRGDAQSTIILGDGTAGSGNTISGNLLEGVYVVNTTSVVQNQTASAVTAPDSAGGNIAGIANINFTLRGSTVNNNGFTAVAGAVDPTRGTGLLLRIGTTDRDGPNFASDPGGSGVTALITDNTFRGNNSIDVYMESFVSTPAPPVAVGTGDPKARLDLVFTGNAGDAIDVSNLGAFYANADQNKSPLGLFGSTTRRRNAQRIGADSGTPEEGPAITQVGVVGAAPVPSSATFGSSTAALNATLGAYNDVQLRFDAAAANPNEAHIITTYTGGVNREFTTFDANFTVAPVVGDSFTLQDLNSPGLGQSTFRVANGLSVTGVNTANAFTTILPNGDFNDGTPFPAAGVGELDFEWSVLPAPAIPPFPNVP